MRGCVRPSSPDIEAPAEPAPRRPCAQSGMDADVPYNIDVPSDAPRDVTPPKMRVGGARHERLLDAYEGAFRDAAPREPPECAPDMDTPPIFTATSRVDV